MGDQLFDRSIAFQMKGQAIRAGGDEVVHQPFGMLQHQMGVKKERGQRAQTADHRCAKGEVGDEHAVHHIQMQFVCTGTFHPRHRIGQTGEITRQDRGG